MFKRILFIATNLILALYYLLYAIGLGTLSIIGLLILLLIVSFIYWEYFFITILYDTFKTIIYVRSEDTSTLSVVKQVRPGLLPLKL